VSEARETNINLLDFQRIGKGKNGEPGTPYDILDAKIADYITQEQLNMFVLNGQPYLYKGGVYHRDEDGKILKAHVKALIWPELVTINRINRVYNLIMSDYRLTKQNDEINSYPAQWINFKNGMLDPLSGVMHPHDSKYFSINQMPHEYDATAEYAGSVADRFFSGLIPDEADRKMFFAFSGCCMTRDTHYQKFLVLTGAPGSGKSTAINYLIKAVGASNTSGLSLQDLGERFAPTELLGKLLNACADLPKTALEQVDAVKRITGEDKVKGEYKGGKVFWFDSYAKLIFSANQMPRSYDEKTAAFYRRILMIDIQSKGAHIPNLKAGLEDSMPGFIRECVKAYADVLRSGKPLDSPNSESLVHEYYRISDSVTAFLDDCTERNIDSRCNCKALYQKYIAYCQDEELNALGRNFFYSDMAAKGYPKILYHGYACFRGISLSRKPPEGDFIPTSYEQEQLPFE
jgi:P4 family phage/plasmid primase-like protien